MGIDPRLCYGHEGHPALQAIAIARSAVIGIDRAHRTLCDAAAFLSAKPASPGADAFRVRYPAKVMGNALRELDRFLSVLLDEIATAVGWSTEDLEPLARIRNTPKKLEAICLRLDIETHHDVRLRALGRCRDALFHCGGIVRRGDSRHVRTLTLGWPGDSTEGASQVLGLGEQLALSPGDLASICAFYVGIGDTLLRSV